MCFLEQSHGIAIPNSRTWLLRLSLWLYILGGFKVFQLWLYMLGWL